MGWAPRYSSVSAPKKKYRSPYNDKDHQMGLFCHRARARHRQALTGLRMPSSKHVVCRYIAVTVWLAALGVSGFVAGALPASAAENYSSVVLVGSPSAGRGTNHAFDGDSCPVATFCMAVGGYDLSGHVQGLSEVLSAGKWVVKPVPSPSQGVNVFANEVSCSSAASCLFVGDHWAGSNGAGANLAEAWNGSSWRIVAAGRPAGASYSYLDDVACPASKFCLVIGGAGTSSSRYHNTAYTWTDGTTWRQVPVPDPAGARNSELSGLACFDAGHCMAVGNYTSATGHYLPFAARWADGRWRILAIPAIAGQSLIIPQGISCPTANECVAAGQTVDNTKQQYYHAFAELWSGGTWHLSTLRAAPSGFEGTSCPSAGQCFATGYTYPSVTGYAHQLIETRNGRTWTTQQPAQTTGLGGNLMHVSCVSATFCEAVGYSYIPGKSNSDAAITEVWNGHRWLRQTTPNP